MKTLATYPIPFSGPLIDYNSSDYQQQYCAINILTKDIFYAILNSFRARDLESLGGTCKHFKKLTENAPMWEGIIKKMQTIGFTLQPKITFKRAFLDELAKNIDELSNKNQTALLAKVCFECDNIYAKKNIANAIELVDLIVDKPTPLEPSLEQSIFIESLLKKAELLSAKKPILEENLETVLDISEEISEMTAASPKQKALAHFLKGKYRFLNSEEGDEDNTDQILFLLMQKFVTDVDLPLAAQAEAEIIICTMVLKDEVTEKEMELKLTKDQALDRLEKISISNEVSIDIKAYAALQLAKFLKINDNYQKAENIFYQIFHDHDVSNEIRMTAAYCLMILRFERRTSIIDDEIAVVNIYKIKACKEADYEILLVSDFYLAMFRYEYRTEKITDDEAYNLFVKVDGNIDLDTFLRYEASLYQAILRFENRTNLINDDEAIIKLNEIWNAPVQLPLELRDKAKKYLNQFLSRAGHEKAHEVFLSIESEEMVEEKAYERVLIIRPWQDNVIFKSIELEELVEEKEREMAEDT